MPNPKPHIATLHRVSHSGKSRGSFLRLDMNENVDGLSEDFVREVLSKISPQFIATYPEYDRLMQKIAKHNGIPPEHICVSNGSDGAIKYIFDAYITPGDSIILTDPTFAMYTVYGRMFGAKITEIQYGPDFNLPYEQLLLSITPKTRLVVIVNPNNPAGSALSLEQLTGIVNKCEKEDVLLIVDEAYFYYHPETVIQQVVHRKNLIVLRTFSKLCSLAAARIGYAAASPEIISNLNKVKPSFDVNGFAVAFAEKLLDHPEMNQASLKRVEEGRGFLVSELSGSGIEFRNGKGNFLLISCPGYVEDIVKSLKKRKILVKGGFEQSFLRDYIRVSIGSKEQMKHFWKEFKKVINELKSQHAALPPDTPI